MTDSYWDGSGYDPETVRFFDVAHEGAQVRALIPAVPQLHAALYGSHPRCVVVIPTDAIARACAHFVAEEQATVPVMVVGLGAPLPTFVGALDTVIVVGERAVADWASHVIIAAAGRGARTILLAPGQGPLREDAPEDALVLPTLPAAAGPSPARYIAGLQAIFASFSQKPEVTEGYLSGVAEQIDEELEQLSPERDASVNPGRSLREFVQGARVIHTGGALAFVIGAVWSGCGLEGTVVEPDALALVLDRRAADETARAGGSEQEVFFDPFLDGPPPVPTKVIQWGTETDEYTADAGGADAMMGTLPVPAASAKAHPLQLIVRAFAATAYAVKPTS